MQCVTTQNKEINYVALLAGRELKLNLAGDLSNTGTVAGRTVMALTAENVNNLAGRISGNAVAVTARN